MGRLRHLDIPRTSATTTTPGRSAAAAVVVGEGLVTWVVRTQGLL